ncbi:tripartite tricarboxylate transporter permease [Billgrantia endophytica]|uniref:C4-dicarboxylate ABC transporter permease n=1 Tax=Billgrantia endophytica TaxID=2033802 RepID=A0A2N7U7S7_9GAMM|nr:tripartite tricarboxylate transporter permease [Halomonas endophytica]PMR76478.1 C4-dicarboxylate ABC transporter permease [Halomonas endophytica]
MELLNHVMSGLEAALGGDTILFAVLGSALGILVGATPGLSSGMAVAVLLPLTFTMSPLSGLVFLTSVYVAVTYGGAITAIMLNTPGAPENAATARDGYALTRQGRSSQALGAAIAASAIGGTLSYFMMLLGIGAIASVALGFGPTEIFLVALCGVMILGALGGGSLIKVLASGMFGLLVGTVGMVPTGEWRATFGTMYLVEGVQVVPVLIGMFVVSELIELASRDRVVEMRKHVPGDVRAIVRGFGEAPRRPFNILRSTGLGILVGLIPAAGGTLASFTSYSLARRLSKQPEAYGKGSLEGIVASETANNACSGGALTVSLVLGVPGSVATAVILGALTMQGLQPGPQIVSQQPVLVYGLICAAILSQALMVIFAVITGRAMTSALAIPTRMLIPVLLMLSIFGTYALRNAMFDVWTMLAFGVLGFFMKRHGYSTAAVVMGVILAPVADSELIRTMQIFGNGWYTAFFTRPVSLLIILGMLGCFLHGLLKARRRPRVVEEAS